MSQEKRCFLYFLFFLLLIIFSFFSSIFDFLAVILPFIKSNQFFIYFIASSSSSMKPSCCLQHVSLIRYSCLSSFLSLSCHFLFSHSSLPTFLFHSFGILFRRDIVLLSVLPLLFCVFHFSKCFFLQHAAILTERFGQTCMTKEQSEMLLLYPLTC